MITSLPKMPSEARARLVTSLSQELRTVRADAVDPLGDVLPILAHATGAQRAAVYGLSAEEQGWSIDFFGILGMPSARGALLRSDIDASFRQGKRFALYDPSKVEAGQRDRVVAASSWRSICEGALPRAIDALRLSSHERSLRLEGVRRVGVVVKRWGLYDLPQMRVVLCDGAAMLAWIGVYSEEMFDRRSHGMFRALVPALRDRMRVEARLGRAGCPIDPLAVVALDHIASAAFVIDKRGRLVTANAAGRARLARAATETRAILDASKAGHTVAGVSVTAVAGRGLPALRLVVADDHAQRRQLAIDRAAQRHGLTPRERQVLERMASGDTNRRIAGVLGCAERTVEVHVTRILAKLDCASRAEATARVLG